MTIDDVLTLVKAGFSREEIAVMAASAEPAPAPEPTPAPAPAPAPEPAPAPAPEPAPQPEARPDMLAQILERFDTMTQALQASAIRGTQQPPKQTTDDILAEIIRPARKEG